MSLHNITITNQPDIVSIIVPVYNVELFIEECIKSIIDQTYEYIECLIIDDRGSDKSIEICKNMISCYNGRKQFRIIQHDKNLGLSEARNTGIKEATGKWIYFLDSDDSLVTNAISHLVSLFRKYPSADIVIGRILCPQDPQRYSFPFCEMTDYIEGNGIGEYLLFTEKIPASVWNKLILRDIVINNNLWFLPRLVHEDEMWMYTASEYFNKIAFAKENTYIHNFGLNMNSIMSKVTLERTRDNWNIILKSIVENPAHYHNDKAILKYLKNLLCYYKKVPDNGTSEKIFNQFLNNIQKSDNRNLVRLLKIYNKLPSDILRYQLSRVINLVISIRLYR